MIFVSACASLPLTSTENICSIFRAKNHWHKSALDMQEKWNLPINVAMAVMHQESRFRRKAKPPRRYLLGLIPWKRRSTAYGYPQAVDGTWQAYVDDTGNHFATRTSFDDSLDFMGWYMNKSAKAAGIGLDDAFRQYLAYHEGWTGYKRRSYEQKPWLITVALDVQALSTRYAHQYESCSDSLKQGFFRSFF